MKRFACVLCLLVLILAGCSGKNASMDRAMAMRARLLSQGAAFDASITADYGDKSFTFAVSCTVDPTGALSFTVSGPQTLAGIRGTVSSEGGKLTFDDQALAFELLADGQVTPVSGPWVLMKTLRSGYLTSCTQEGQLLRLSIDDSYRDDALHLDIWLGADDTPVRGEILWQGRRILSMDVSNFRFL